MIKSRHIIRLVTLQAALCLLFSISSFADGYSFQNDGDQWQQNFSGTNKIYTDGIYVGEMGAIDAYMDNFDNTYNGTNIIDATAYPGAGQDDDSTYNGSLDVTANDIVSSKTTINDATVNASTAVEVNDVLAENNLNAGVQFNNSNFNNDVTLSGSGAVNLEGSTINNLVLGNIPQMASLLDEVFIVYTEFTLNYFYTDAHTSINRTNPFTGNTVAVPLFPYIIRRFNYTNNDFTTTEYRHWGTFFSYLNDLFNDTIFVSLRALAYCVRDTYLDQIGYKTYAMYYFARTTESYTLSTTTGQYNWKEVILNRFSVIISLLDYYCSRFYEWYYPPKPLTDNQYWIAFNTDTEQYDNVNLSTVFGYITWYLGQLYIQGNEAAADITQSVTDLSDTLTDFEIKEGQINSSIKSSLDTVDSFFDLPVITGPGTVIGWLQYMWVSLAEYQAITIIAWALVILTIVTGFYKVKRITV